MTKIEHCVILKAKVAFLKFGGKMKSTYRNALRSKQLIREAVISLLSKKQDVSQISVAEIVKLANINRGTFYNHYNNVMEVLQELENELFDELNLCLKNNSSKDVSGVISTLAIYFKKHEEDYKQIVKGMTKAVLNDLKSKCTMQLSKIYPHIDEVKLMFIVNGLAGLYFDYLDGRFNLSLEEIGKQASMMINSIISMPTNTKN